MNASAGQPRANKRGWSTAGAALSAMLSVTLTRHPVSTLTPAPAVPALERWYERACSEIAPR